MSSQELDELKPIVAAMNRIAAEMMGGSPNYRYFEDKNKNKYFWTTEPITEKGKKRFISGVYRYFKTKKKWILKKKVMHAKRNKAKARAEKMYHKAMEKKNETKN